MVPCGIEEDNLHSYLPNEITTAIQNTSFFIVEDLRSARRFIKKIDKTKDIDACTFFELNEHTAESDFEKMIQPVLHGHDAVVVSESGCPGIADPGQQVAKIAHKNDIHVVPFVGPSSVLLALMASGQNGQHFKFIGYLPKEQNLRKTKLKELEREISTTGISVLFIETPYRNMHVFDDICTSLNEQIILTVASEIKSNQEYIKTKPVQFWKKNKPAIEKKNTVFILGKA